VSRLRRTASARLGALGLAATTALAGAVAATVAAAPSAIAANTSQFRGVNWADPRDNFADDPVVPSGLSTSDSYGTVFATATAVVNGLQANLGANTLRLPVNPFTVNGPFWAAYTGAIDAATAKGFNVILSYWEGVAHRDGLVDDLDTFWAMWQTITAKYTGNSRVFFEPMNEPHGYSASAWANLAAQWISTFPAVPKGRIFVSGTGFNDNVTSVCADSRLAGTFLSLHDYAFFNTSQNTYAGWVADVRNRLGSCASRTVADEWGAPQTTGLDYNGAISGSNNFVSYLQAATDVFHALGMGSVYWPGLRTGDRYSMETLHGSGANLTLTDNNASGASRLRWAWGLTGAGATAVRGTGSGRCLDVPGLATANGTQLDLWDCNAGSNQSFLYTPARTLVVYGNKCLDVAGASTAPGTKVQLWDCNATPNQQWNRNGNGTITSAQTGLCLDATAAGTGNGTRIEVFTCDGGANQVWSRS
jgi:Ricin-type beta-trefoil lectin domain/Cellulase (glycosyl hydrolase family 5)